MEHQVALYLFKRKYCVLPEVGTLKIEEQPAKYAGADQQLYPPSPFVSFTHGKEESDLTEYIAASNSISISSASAYVNAFCERIRNLGNEESVNIPSAGTFSINKDGVLQYVADIPDPAFLPVVDAKTIVRTADHSVLVGDIESNATRMTAYFSETIESKRAKWKVFAVILFIISAGWLAWHFLYMKNDFGNSKTIEADSPSSTYSVSQPAK
jgi:hypothetical protein